MNDRDLLVLFTLKHQKDFPTLLFHELVVTFSEKIQPNVSWVQVQVLQNQTCPHCAIISSLDPIRHHRGRSKVGDRFGPVRVQHSMEFIDESHLVST